MFSRTKRKVAFVIGGTQKSGTSALDVYLRLHPSICMAEIKEPHFFDDDEYFSLGDPDYRIYHTLFKPRNGKQILGESTPIYSYWEPAAERIKAYNPGIKWILLLRNPVERAFSHWKMEFANRKEHRPFSSAIRTEQEAIGNGTYHQHRTASYISRGFYSEQISRIWSIFSKEQTLILKQESLREDPTRTVNSVLEFLGVEKLNSVAHQDVFSSAATETISQSDRRLLAAIYAPEIERLKKLLNWDCSSWLTD